MAIYKLVHRANSALLRVYQKAKSNGLELLVDFWTLTQMWAAWPWL